MRKILLIIIFSMSFYSCDSILNPDHVNDTGIIHKIEASTWMYGTHTLEDSNSRPMYALKSSTIDLSLYENKLVTVDGKLIEGYPVDGGPEYLNVTGISVIK